MPYGRAYLYLRKDAFYADTVNVGVGADGMLTSSDTSSQQEITAILTELAQTAATLVTPSTPFGEYVAVPEPDPRKQCFQALNDLVQSGPFYKQFIVDDQIAKTGYFQRQLESHSTLISSGPPIFLEISPAFRHPVHESIGAVHPGLVAFFPVPARTAITCGLPDADDPKTPSTPILLSPPQTVYLYTESHFLDPQRDFLTQPAGWPLV
jgi:hypothetical protein